MKNIFPKLLFIVFLVLGISSFVLLKKTKPDANNAEVGNIRFNSEMDNGFVERE